MKTIKKNKSLIECKNSEMRIGRLYQITSRGGGLLKKIEKGGYVFWEEYFVLKKLVAELKKGLGEEKKELDLIYHLVRAIQVGLQKIFLDYEKGSQRRPTLENEETDEKKTESEVTEVLSEVFSHIELQYSTYYQAFIALFRIDPKFALDCFKNYIELLKNKGGITSQEGGDIRDITNHILGSKNNSIKKRLSELLYRLIRRRGL